MSPGKPASEIQREACKFTEFAATAAGEIAKAKASEAEKAAEAVRLADELARVREQAAKTPDVEYVKVPVEDPRVRAMNDAHKQVAQNYPGAVAYLQMVENLTKLNLSGAGVNQ